MTKFGGWKNAYALLLVCAATVIGCPAQTFRVLKSFDDADGSSPSGLVQATDGNFYGTTSQGGKNYLCPVGGCGTVFKVAPGGKLTTLYSFCSQTNCADGGAPYAGLIQANNGYFYGTTLNGGANCSSSEECGTIFEVTPRGKLITLYSFCSQTNCADGAVPYAGLMQAANGNFYGATTYGGAYCVSSGGCGTIFEITPKGKFTTLYSFCPQSHCADGSLPTAALVQATDGNLYGTTNQGGANCVNSGGCGTVFAITPKGKLTTLHSFCSQTGCPDGYSPLAGVVQGTNGDFYGTTTAGGANNEGTIFRLTPTGKFTTNYSFCSLSNCADGRSPLAPLVQATDGNFYGTTEGGGATNAGTIFEITPKGKLAKLHSFCPHGAPCSGGAFPTAGLVQAADGNFYGTTEIGGVHGENGTVFRLAVDRW